MADGHLNFDTKIDESGFNSGLKSVAGAATAAMAAVTASFGAASTYAFKVGSDFEAGMSKVSAISGASGKELEQLKDKAKEMGATTKFSATEAASAMQYMAMAGWKTRDMISGIDGIMNLAAASGEGLAATSDIVTDALTAFGLAASDSGHFADILAAASSNANTNVSMMGETFKYVAPVAGSLGYSAEDCAVAIGLMANSGIKASQAGTALRSMFSRLAEPTDKVETAMRSLNISLTDSGGNMKSLDEIMGDLRDGFSGLSEAEQAQMAFSLAGQDAMSGLLAIVNASDDDFNNLKDAIYNCDGVAANMAETMQDNLQGSITILKSALEGLGIEIYESMETPLRNAVQLGTEYISQLTEAFQTGGADGLIEAGANILTDVMVGMAKQMPKVISLATGVIQSVVDSLNSNLPQILSAGGDILRSLYDGAVAILPSVCSLGYNVVTSITSRIASYAPVLIQNGIDLLSQLGSGLRQAIPEFLANALPMLQSFSASLLENAGLLVYAGIDFIYNIVAGIVESLPLLIEYGPTIIKNIADIINENAPKLLFAGASIISQLIIGIVENIPNLLAHFPEIISAIIAVFGAINWVGIGKSIIKGIEDGVKTLAENIPKALKDIGNTAKDWLSLIEWKTLGQDIIDLIKIGLESLASLIPTSLKNIGKTAKDWMSLISWKTLGRDIIDLIKIGLESLATAIPTALKAVGKQAMTSFTSLDWGGIGKNIISGIASGISGAAGQIASAAKKAAQNALNAAKKLLGIASPSKRARKEVGQMYGKGLELGILDEAEDVEKASEVLANSTVKEIDAPDYTSIATMARNKVSASTAAIGKRIIEHDNLSKDPNGGFDYNKLKSIVADALKELNLVVEMDGKAVGHIATPTVDEDMSDMEELKRRGC